MDSDFDWTAPATLWLFIGKDEPQAGDDVGSVAIKTGTAAEAVAFYSQCSDWVKLHSRLHVHGALQVGGYDIGDLADRLDHAP